MNRLRLFATLWVGLWCATLAHADLVHQYTFNDGTANDSGPGAANGNIVDPLGISQFVGGQLDLLEAIVGIAHLLGVRVVGRVVAG